MTSRTVVKLMSITRADFDKSLAALDAGASPYDSSRAKACVDGATAEITFEPMPQRLLGGLLAMPQARVTISFPDDNAGTQAQFLRRFEIAFQRGGG